MLVYFPLFGKSYRTYDILNWMRMVIKEYDKERGTARREWEGNCTVSKVKENSNLPSLFSFYFSYFSLFNFSLLSIFLCNLVIIIQSESVLRFLIREMESVIVCTTFLHQILSVIPHSYFAYFAFHYFLVLHAIFLSSCALLFTCTISHSILPHRVLY